MYVVLLPSFANRCTLHFCSPQKTLFVGHHSFVLNFIPFDTYFKWMFGCAQRTLTAEQNTVDGCIFNNIHIRVLYTLIEFSSIFFSFSFGSFCYFSF